MPKYTVIYSSKIIVKGVEANKKSEVLANARKIYESNSDFYDANSKRKVIVKRERG